MTDTRPEAQDAREAEQVGEKPDLGHRSDALIDALSGTDSGSDTRAGSLQGGAATGSDNDPDQEAVNAALASEGMVSPQGLTGPGGDPAEGKTDLKANSGDGRPQAGDDADAATG